MAILLGIDPGSHHTGFGVIDKENNLQLMGFGVISANANWSFEDRLLKMGDEVEKLILQYQPMVMVLEEAFQGKNVKSSFVLAQVRGVYMYLAKKHGILLKEYATRSVKKGVTGNGNANKEQVALTLQALLGQKIEVDQLDASDAIALAYYHATKMEIFEKFGSQML